MSKAPIRGHRKTAAAARAEQKARAKSLRAAYNATPEGLAGILRAYADAELFAAKQEMIRSGQNHTHVAVISPDPSQTPPVGAEIATTLRLQPAETIEQALPSDVTLPRPVPPGMVRVCVIVPGHMMVWLEDAERRVK
jgi:hypothetical protein